MQKLRTLWNAARTTLHYGPSTEPLWAHVVELLHNFEARITSLETGLQDRINALLTNAEVSLHTDFQTVKSEYDSVIANLQARIAALEGHPAMSIPPLAPVIQLPTGDVQIGVVVIPAPAPEPISEPVIAPTETIVHPDQPAAASAPESSSPTITPLTPSAQPSPDPAGLNTATTAAS